MSIGLVSKPSGVRLVTGSEHYGMRKKEAHNLQFREFPVKSNGRTVMILGQTCKQVIEVIAAPVKPKKTRKPATKSAAAKLAAE